MTTPSAASSSEVAIDEKHGAPSEEMKPPMAGLSEQEREIIERQIEAPKLDVGYFALFRYASRNEFIIMVIAVIASIDTHSKPSRILFLTASGMLHEGGKSWHNIFGSRLSDSLLSTSNGLQQIVYGNFAGSFTSFSVDAVAIEAFQKRINELTLYFVYLGKLSAEPESEHC
jgi:ATP-binding cassette subfamily B (MDR/TAP) protein 1